jgi:hypothetical protein
MTTTSQMAGDMPAMNTGTMTTQQKAQLDAALKAAMAEHTDTSKTCLTKEDLSKANFMAEDDDGLKCKQAFTANTKTLLEGNVTCTGDRSMSGHMRVEAASPTSMKMAMNMTTTEDGKTIKMTISTTGKWLGAACGSVQ